MDATLIDSHLDTKIKILILINGIVPKLDHEAVCGGNAGSQNN